MKESLFNLPKSLSESSWVLSCSPQLHGRLRSGLLSLSLPHVHSKGQVTREKKWRRSNTQQLSVWGTGDEWQHVCHCIMSGALSALRNCLHAPRCAQAQWRFTLTPIRQHIEVLQWGVAVQRCHLVLPSPWGRLDVFSSHLYRVNEMRSWQCVSIFALFWQEGKSPMSTAARLKRWIHYFCLD